jgi:hypothetical protein
MQIAQETINSQEKARIIMEMTQQQYLEQPPPANEATSDGKGQEPVAPPEALHATANPPFPEPSPTRPRKRPAAKSLLRRIGQFQFFNKSQANASEDVDDGGDKSEKPAKTMTLKPAQKKAIMTGKSANKKPVPKKATVAKKTAPEAVWVGTPTDDLEGGWPKGWTKKLFERKSGATKGHKDRYWYSPINGFKLRSMIDGAYANTILFYFHLLDC